MMTWHRLGICLICFLSVGLSAPHTSADEVPMDGDPETIALAQRYMAAYLAFDIEALSEFYTEDTLFTDPTSFNTPRVATPYHWRGRKAITEAFSGFKDAVIQYRYDLDRIFEASGRVVYIGRAIITAKGEDGPVTTQADIVTIVTIENGKVSEHRDYANYIGGQTTTGE